MFSDGVVELVEKGVITNTKKKTHVGKFVANFLMGTKRLYDFVNNSRMRCYPVDYAKQSGRCREGRNNIVPSTPASDRLMDRPLPRLSDIPRSPVSEVRWISSAVLPWQRMAVPFSPSRPQPRREPFPRLFRCLISASCVNLEMTWITSSRNMV